MGCFFFANLQPFACVKLSPVNIPSPALVTQRSVRRLPRWALVVLCFVYLAFGFLDRLPWKPMDVTSLGYMLSLAYQDSTLLHLQIAGLPPELDALLPYWLGAMGIQLLHPLLSIELASRIPFILLTLLSLVCTWNAIYYLARNPQAQPVAFAFGGEANPKDYARSLADAGILALLACLGLALPLHETTPMAIQFDCMALVFFGAAVLPFYPQRGLLAWGMGLLMLTLSGAPFVAMVVGVGSAFLWAKHPQSQRSHCLGMCLWIVVLIALAFALDVWRWRVSSHQDLLSQSRQRLELLVWFLWPAWPLAAWTLWRWRGHWGSQWWSQHLVLPLFLFFSTLIASVTTQDPDRTLLLSLPAIAALAAFALPTLGRSVAALIDWFTLLFFTWGAVMIWGVWISLETGVPAQPALNVARLVPGYEHSSDPWHTSMAVLVTAIWVGLVVWRIGRHPSAIWKSLVLPATGAALCWVLLTTLWLPILNRALSYEPWSLSLRKELKSPNCIYAVDLQRSQLAGLGFHAHFNFKALPQHDEALQCEWLFTSVALMDSFKATPTPQWTFHQRSKRPADKNEEIVIFKRSNLVAHE